MLPGIVFVAHVFGCKFQACGLRLNRQSFAYSEVLINQGQGTLIEFIG